jgi:hypothetical protein
MRQVRDHLSRQLADEEDDPHDKTCEDSVSSGDIGSEIIDFLESCGLDPKIIERVKGLIDSGNGDGDLLLQHKDDQDPTGFDPTMSRSAAGAMSPGMDDTVPAFPGKPEVGGGQVSLSDRRMALDSMARIRIADDAGCLHRARDMPRPRKPKPVAVDSGAGFYTRFPEARRIQFR